MAEFKNGTPQNHMIPFLWMHGEDEPRLREVIDAIDKSGIGALCVESRPHPDFVGEKWWRDMDIVLDECHKRNMGVWILDDEHFPTGYTAGRAAESEYRIKYISERHMDIAGPQTGSSILLNLQIFDRKLRGDIKIISVVAARRIPGQHMNRRTYMDIEQDPVENLINLTDKIDGDVVYWDIPEGLWRIFIVAEHYGNPSEGHSKYLNPLTPEGTRILIDTVYESHYQHYAAEFGKTIRGFFSDEPSIAGRIGYHTTLGHTPNMQLPWSGEVLDMMSAALGCDARGLLPGLWCDIGDMTSRVRYAFMDTVTKLYGKNFCTQIGDWCRAHNVEYMGHVIEENNANTCVGMGTGHYFRSLWGQDLAGIDVVLSSLVPGIKGASHTWEPPLYEADDDFFYYELAQLATSLAHIDTKKHGRAMCEIFGAYGWQEGLREMKWLADFMMSRGINEYVPHAFTPKDFPDPDCPPHFYAFGQNPQYRYFRILMDYMNRVCSMVSGGKSLVNVGVLYHADAEWADSETAMPSEGMVKLLTQAQIECDIIPGDSIINAEAESGALAIGDYRYRAIVVPYAKQLPGALIEALGRAAQAGVLVIFSGALPEKSCTYKMNVEKALLGCSALEDDDIVKVLVNAGLRYASADSFQPDLKLFPYMKDGRVNLLMFNEGILRPIDVQLTISTDMLPVLYDPYEDKAYAAAYKNDADKLCVNVHLEPYAMNVLVLSNEQISGSVCDTIPENERPLAIERVSTATASEYPSFTVQPQITAPCNLNQSDALPRFSGTIRYECAFEAAQSERMALDLGEVGETAEVTLNGQRVGVKIVPPYTFDISEFVRDGRNELTIDVTNTLVYRMHDRLSVYHAIAASGLIGPVRLLCDMP